MRKKVLIIAPFHHGTGGAETYLIGLMEEACKRFDVFLATLEKPPQTWQGTPIHKVLGICWELWREAWKYERTHPDTIDCHGLQAALVGALIKKQIFRYWMFTPKLCVTILALYDFKDRPWWFRFVCRTILNRADVIFVEGETGKKDLLDCGVKEEKLKPFMHWVDVNVYKPAPRNHKGVNVLFVGRPIPIKGKYIVEEVERKLFYLKGLTFRYIENCPHKDLIQHYQWADILVVPSQYSEGFPRVVFEGAACGCMVIASNKGALSELVDNFGVTNLWDWGQGIAMFYSQPKTVKAYQRKSRLYATKFFTPKNAETILNEY